MCGCEMARFWLEEDDFGNDKCCCLHCGQPMDEKKLRDEWCSFECWHKDNIGDIKRIVAEWVNKDCGLEGVLIGLNNEGIDIFYDATESTRNRLINVLKHRAIGNKKPCLRRVDKSFDMRLNTFLDKEKAANAVTQKTA